MSAHVHPLVELVGSSTIRRDDPIRNVIVTAAQPIRHIDWFEAVGARSYIVCGKGSPESFCSSAHGADRRMSRTAAAKRFTAADLVRQTEGVICRKDKGVVDEIPGAYKDIDEVMANQRDLTEIVHTLKQVVCVKG